MVECRTLRRLIVYFKSHLSWNLSKNPGCSCEVFSTFVIPFRFLACLIWFYGLVNTVRVMSGRSGNRLIILYRNHTKFQGPTVAQIV